MRAFALGLGLVLTAACTSGRLVARQTYYFDSDVDPAEVAYTTADALGFTPELVDGGISLTTLPEGRFFSRQLFAETAPGELVVTGPAVSFFPGPDSLGPSTQVWVAAMHDVLEEKPTLEAAKPKSEGAIVVIVVLDVLAPWLGTLYTNPGNPYAQQSTWLRFFLRLVADVGAVGVTLEPRLISSHSTVLDAIFVGAGIFDLALGRVLAVLDDMTMLPFRAALDKAGFALPGTLPEPLTTTMRW